MKLIRMYVEIARLLIVQVRGQAVRARREGRNDLGASAIEWAIISAIVVALAMVIFGVVRGVVDNNADKIKEGNNT